VGLTTGLGTEARGKSFASAANRTPVVHGLFTLGFTTKFWYPFLIYVMRATCCNHVIRLDLIAVLMFIAEYE
jgi:hypothetical protein